MERMIEVIKEKMKKRKVKSFKVNDRKEYHLDELGLHIHYELMKSDYYPFVDPKFTGYFLDDLRSGFLREWLYDEGGV